MAVAVTGDRPIGELVDGPVVRQEVSAATVDLPASGRPAAACADVRIVTFRRSNVGTVTFGVMYAGVASSQTLAAADLSDWQLIRTCVDLAEVDVPVTPGPLAPVAIEVRADEAPPGAAIGALGATGRVAGTMGELVDVTSGPLVMELLVLRDPPSAPLSRSIDRVAQFLPWIILLLGVGALIADGAAPRAEAQYRRT